MNSEIIADIFILVGLAALGCGLWLIQPWVSLSAVGLLVFGLGLASFFIQK